MLAKYAAAAMAGSMLLASAAFAAETATTPSTSTTDKAGMTQGSVSDVSYTGSWRASKVVGLNVYNEQNENVGAINDLLMDKSGNVKAAVISVGGFLGIGTRYVAIAFDKMKFSDQPVAYTGASNAPAGGAGGGMAKPASTTTTTGSAATQPASTAKPNPWYPDHAVFNASKDELKNMPEFKYTE
jgi:sporulation protein YlmC with PRC-barrel domain